MTLTGPAFLAVVCVLALAAFVLVLVRWPALSHRTPVALALRAAALVGVNLTVVLVAAAALNDTYLFYADWTDLYDAFGGHVTASVAHAGAPGATAPGQLASKTPVLNAPGAPAGASPTNRVLRFTVTGAMSGVTGAVEVVLPKSYFDPANRLRRYPVLEAFHGIPGGPDQWVDTIDLPVRLERLSAAKALDEPIVAIPALSIPAGRDTECVNGTPDEEQMETWLTEDVPDWLQREFRVRVDASSWATIGFSEGGWCAAMATMLHPDQYSAAIILGGYFRPSFGSYRPFPANSAEARRYDLVALEKRDPPPVAIWLETSHSDAVSYASSAAFLHVARAPTSVTATVLAHAGHRFNVWLQYLDPALRWLGSTVPGFQP